MDYKVVTFPRDKFYVGMSITITKLSITMISLLFGAILPKIFMAVN